MKWVLALMVVAFLGIMVLLFFPVLLEVRSPLNATANISLYEGMSEVVSAGPLFLLIGLAVAIVWGIRQAFKGKGRD